MEEVGLFFYQVGAQKFLFVQMVVLISAIFILFFVYIVTDTAFLAAISFVTHHL